MSKKREFYIKKLLLQPGDLMKWKQVAARFNELIAEAAMQLHRDEQRAVQTETVLNSVKSFCLKTCYSVL